MHTFSKSVLSKELWFLKIPQIFTVKCWVRLVEKNVCSLLRNINENVINVSYQLTSYVNLRNSNEVEIILLSYVTVAQRINEMCQLTKDKLI